jgi:hypothetical protein
MRGGAGASLDSWVTWALAAGGPLVSYLIYRRQRGRKQLEFVVLRSGTILPGGIGTRLSVSYNEIPVPEPAIITIRLVNTGDKAITLSDFHTPLAVVLREAAVVAASVAATRPVDLEPQLDESGGKVSISPLLLNPADLIELELLTSRAPSSVTVEGRIADVTVKRRASLPYPPGSGPEGEMLGFDRFMWYGAPIILFLVLLAAINSMHASGLAKAAGTVGVAFLFLVAYPMQTKRLVRRRRIWRP